MKKLRIEQMKELGIRKLTKKNAEEIRGGTGENDPRNEDIVDFD